MPITYSIQATEGYILEEWSGTVTIQDLREYWTAYLADPEVMQIRKTVANLGMAKLKFTGDELDGLVQSLVVPKLKGLDWKTALVVSQPAQFGVARQYQVFADRYSRDAIFSDVDAAQQWLKNR